MASSHSRLSFSASATALRSVMSRIAAVMSVSRAVCSGPRLISAGNSVPSLRRPTRSRPAPRRRVRGARAVRFAVVLVQVAEGIRDEEVHRGAEDLLARVPEHLLRAGVGQDDIARDIHHDDGVGRKIHQATKIVDLGKGAHLCVCTIEAGP